MTLEEAKEVIKNYPDVDSFIDAHYSQRFVAGFGMDDNGIDLSSYWHECNKLVNPTTTDKQSQ